MNDTTRDAIKKFTETICALPELSEEQSLLNGLRCCDTNQLQRSSYNCLVLESLKNLDETHLPVQLCAVIAHVKRLPPSNDKDKCLGHIWVAILDMYHEMNHDITTYTKDAYDFANGKCGNVAIPMQQREECQQGLLNMVDMVKDVIKNPENASGLLTHLLQLAQSQIPNTDLSEQNQQQLREGLSSVVQSLSSAFTQTQ